MFFLCILVSLIKYLIIFCNYDPGMDNILESKGYKKETLLGKGAFGSVYLAVYTADSNLKEYK